MNTIAIFLLAAALPGGLILSRPAWSSPANGPATQQCTLGSPGFRECVSSSSATSVRRNPAEPEAISSHIIAVRNFATGAYEESAVLLPSSGYLDVRLAGVFVRVSNENQPDGSIAVVIKTAAKDGSIRTYVDGEEQLADSSNP